MLMGMNEDSYVGKIQRKRRVLFLGKGNFQKKEKKRKKEKEERAADASIDIFSHHRIEEESIFYHLTVVTSIFFIMPHEVWKGDHRMKNGGD